MEKKYIVFYRDPLSSTHIIKIPSVDFMVYDERLIRLVIGEEVIDGILNDVVKYIPIINLISIDGNEECEYEDDDVEEEDDLEMTKE